MSEAVYINEYFADGIEVPFGGNRFSGFGREKGLAALHSYCKLKSVAARVWQLGGSHRVKPCTIWQAAGLNLWWGEGKGGRST